MFKDFRRLHVRFAKWSWIKQLSIRNSECFPPEKNDTRKTYENYERKECTFRTSILCCWEPGKFWSMSCIDWLLSEVKKKQTCFFFVSFVVPQRFSLTFECFLFLSCDGGNFLVFSLSCVLDCRPTISGTRNERMSLWTRLFGTFLLKCSLWMNRDNCISSTKSRGNNSDWRKS